MSIWRASSVDDTPVIELVCWHVFEVPAIHGENYDRHFAGYNVTEYEGRASSKIIEYDSETGIGTTRSGRKYKLIGPSGHGNDILAAGDAAYVWENWCRMNKINPDECKNVSDEYDIPGEDSD